MTAANGGTPLLGDVFAKHCAQVAVPGYGAQVWVPYAALLAPVVGDRVVERTEAGGTGTYCITAAAIIQRLEVQVINAYVVATVRAIDLQRPEPLHCSLRRVGSAAPRQGPIW